MPDEGYIKEFRKSREHWLYQKKPFDEWHAWEDIRLDANHKNGKCMIGKQIVPVNPGQTVTSLRKLGERWGWGQEKVRRFLNLLVSDGMIEIECDTTKTVITVVNWAFYQVHDGKARHERDTSETQTVTNKNVKNGNNTSLSQVSDSDAEDFPNYEKPPNAFAHDSDAYKCAKYLDKRICQNIPSKKPSDEQTLQRWARDIDKIHRIDKQSWDDISDVLEFCQSDAFWSTNILSGKKLREKFIQLMAKLRRNND